LGGKEGKKKGKTQERNVAYPHLYILQDCTKGTTSTEADVYTHILYIAV